MDKNSYELLAEAIAAIAPELVKDPGTPVRIAVDEAETLEDWANHDRAELKANGLDVSLIDALHVRAGALRYTDAMWIADTESRKHTDEQWNEMSPRGFDLVDVLLHTYKFAYRNNPQVLNRVKEIDQEDTQADMVHDLLSCALLGKKHPAPLKAINFDFAQLDEAASLANTLGDLLAENNNAKQRASELKETRDKAYAYLKLAVDEVRDYGKFVFWRNPDRLKGYSSAYKRN